MKKHLSDWLFICPIARVRVMRLYGLADRLSTMEYSDILFVSGFEKDDYN